MRSKVHQQHEQALNSSHHGQPILIEQVYTGRWGQPAIHIDPDFLQWAYSLQPTFSIGRFLHVSRQTVHSALLEHGIAAPQANPFISSTSREDQVATDSIADSLLNPDLPIPPTLPSDILEPASARGQATGHAVSFTRPLSTLSDSELDKLILRLRRHYCRAGVTMLNGMILHLGHHIPRECIRQSLIRIDPVQ